MPILIAIRFSQCFFYWVRDIKMITIYGKNKGVITNIATLQIKHYDLINVKVLAPDLLNTFKK